MVIWKNSNIFSSKLWSSNAVWGNIAIWEGNIKYQLIALCCVQGSYSFPAFLNNKNQLKTYGIWDHGSIQYNTGVVPCSVRLCCVTNFASNIYSPQPPLSHSFILLSPLVHSQYILIQQKLKLSHRKSKKLIPEETWGRQ